jgi:hypothetical protein
MILETTAVGGRGGIADGLARKDCGRPEGSGRQASD